MSEYVVSSMGGRNGVTITLPPASDERLKFRIDTKQKCIVNSITPNSGETIHAEPGKRGGWVIEINKS